jgi:hypothetical protein
MEYKGIEYQITQTANPIGWIWTVRFEGKRPRTGLVYNRAIAVALAQRCIDRMLKKSPPEIAGGGASAGGLPSPAREG